MNRTHKKISKQLKKRKAVDNPSRPNEYEKMDVKKEVEINSEKFTVLFSKVRNK